ncbi:ATP-binding protein [Micromonospora sp. NPDC005173]|uniref:ATP-binding protein n=1 Tax=Micromonospora sp. NPDC005173 TaxID=3157165 RepID=UPI0033B3D4C6
MSNRLRREEVIPSAARLTNSLRDLGYDFVNAVADLVDNSISANAGRVDITIAFDGPESWVRIADDGDGMAGANISEAMRLGAARDYGSADLGKFGLGLKTASLSQCRQISVASRTNKERRQIEVRQLDLDHVIDTDRWEILHLPAAERPNELVVPLHTSTGTVVIWKDLDRVLNFNDPWGGWAKRHLLQLAHRLELHLGMVFGRFISGEAKRRKKLIITLNGNHVEAWDPFVRHEGAVEYLPVKDLKVGDGLVRYQPFVLPPQREFSSDAAWQHTSGPKQWNRQQGFYIYRADRMIQSGGWSGMRTLDEHTKLARAAIEFWPDLDDAFEINISKMRVRLPEQLREQLVLPVRFLASRANEKYRVGGRAAGKSSSPRRRAARASPPVEGEGRATPTGAGNGGGEGFGSTSQPTDERVLEGAAALSPAAGMSMPPELAPAHLSVGVALRPRTGDGPLKAADALQRAADKVGQSEALALIRQEICQSEPEVASEIGW